MAFFTKCIANSIWDSLPQNPWTLTSFRWLCTHHSPILTFSNISPAKGCVCNHKSTTAISKFCHRKNKILTPANNQTSSTSGSVDYETDTKTTTYSWSKKDSLFGKANKECQYKYYFYIGSVRVFWGESGGSPRSIRIELILITMFLLPINK